MIKLIFIGIILFSTLSSEWIEEGDTQYIEIVDREDYVVDIRVSSKDSNLIFVQSTKYIKYVDKKTGNIVKTIELPYINDMSNEPTVSYDENIYSVVKSEYYDNEKYNNINYSYYTERYEIETNELIETDTFLLSKENFYLRSLYPHRHKTYTIDLKEENGDNFQFANLFVVRDSTIPVFSSENVNYLLNENNYQKTDISYINNLQGAIKFNNFNKEYIYKYNDEHHLVKNGVKIIIKDKDLFAFSNKEDEYIEGELIDYHPTIYKLSKIDIKSKDTLTNYTSHSINEIIPLNDEYFIGVRRFGSDNDFKSYINYSIYLYSYKDIRPISKLYTPAGIFSSLNLDSKNNTLYLSHLNRLNKYKLDFEKINNYLIVDFKTPKYIEKDSLTQFYNLTIGEFDSLKWEFSNGFVSKKINPEISFDEVGNYSFNLKIFKNDTVYTKQSSFYVYEDNLIADFEIENLSNNPPYSVNLINKSKGNITNFKWYFNNKVISEGANTSLIIDNNGNNTFKLEISNLFTKKLIEKEFFFINKEINDEVVLNSGITNNNFRISYGSEVGKFYVAKPGFVSSNIIGGPMGNSNYKYFNKYNNYIIEGNKMIENVFTFDSTLIFEGIKHKKAKLYFQSVFTGLYGERFYSNDFNTEIMIFQYHNYTGAINLSHASYNYRMVVIYNSIDTMKLDLGEISNLSQIINTGFNKLYNFLVFNKNKSYHLVDLKNKNTSGFYLNQSNSNMTDYKHIIKIFIKDSNNLRVLNFDTFENSFDTVNISTNFKNNNILTTSSDSIYSYLAISDDVNSKLLLINNETDVVENEIMLKLDNPQKIIKNGEDLIALGSHKGILAYEQIIDNDTYLYNYNNLSATFTNAESNNKGTILAQVTFDKTNNNSYLIKFELGEIGNVIESKLPNNLNISNNSLLLPNSPSKIEIFDVLGRKITQIDEYDNKEFDLNYLENGIYLYKVKSGSNNYSGKFLR